MTYETFEHPNGTVGVVRVDDDGTVWYLGDGEADVGYLAHLEA
jgi:streptogramin lyase|tara:strand:+ start:1161 stop:1289 length:129 start_codon:yes stop_codon:yes gene_type:complete